MGRPLRIQYPGAFYHICTRGLNRQNIFLEPKDYLLFLSLIDGMAARYNVRVHAYALMPNHYHLLLETPRGNLSDAMRQLNSRYASAFNRIHSRVGYLFQGRFQALIVEKEVYLLELVRYLHLNPVRAKIASRADQFLWSSHRAYLGLETKPSWLRTDEVLRFFDRKRNEASKALHAFVNEGLIKPPWNPEEHTIVGTFLGSDSFVANMCHTIPPLLPDEEIKPLRQLRRCPSLEIIDNVVQNIYKPYLKTRPFDKQAAREGRQVALFLAHLYSGKPLKEIARYFGGQRYSFVSLAARRIRERMIHDHKFRSRVREIERILFPSGRIGSTPPPTSPIANGKS